MQHNYLKITLTEITIISVQLLVGVALNSAQSNAADWMKLVIQARNQ